MKKILFLTICILSAAALSAQVVVGGSINFSSSTRTNTGYYDQNESLSKSPSSFSFGLAPRVGYVINDKFEVGGKINLSSNQYTEFVTLADEQNNNPKVFKNFKRSDFVWAIQPYARWAAVNVNGFGLWIEGLVSIGSEAQAKVKYYPVKYSADGYEYRSAAEAEQLNNKEMTDDKVSYVKGGLYIQPVLTYTINEHFRLETALNFLGFNLSGTSTKRILDDEGNWDKSNTCNFGLNINSDNIAQVGLITIGCVYAF